MATVTETIRINATPDQVWEMIGEFNGLNTWHPAVAKSEQYEEGGVVYRKLTLGDGAVIIESMDDHSHDRAQFYLFHDRGRTDAIGHLSGDHHGERRRRGHFRRRVDGDIRTRGRAR